MISDIICILIEALLMIAVLIVLVHEPAVIRFEDQLIEKIRARHQKKKTESLVRDLEEMGLSAVPAPVMTAEEIVRICDL